MKHLERVRRLLKTKEDEAKQFRRFADLWKSDKFVDPAFTKERAEKNRAWAEDAEFEAELLREYIEKWEAAERKEAK